MKLLFECEVLADNGVTVHHHAIVRSELSSDLTKLFTVIESWPSEAQRLAGIGAIDAVRVDTLVSDLVLTDGLHAGLLAAVFATPKYALGVAVEDSAESLAGAQSRQMADLLSYRQGLEFGPLTFDGDVFDGDAVAQTRVVGATMAAAVARMAWLKSAVQALATAASVTLPTEPTFGLHWTLADDSERDMDEADMYGLLDAFAARGEETHIDWRVVRQEILDAATVEDARSVVWPA